jgi:hypothetical protein
MMGCATNCEIDGSSGGADEGLKPNAASEAVGCAPETLALAGTAGCAPTAGAGVDATGVEGGGAALGAGAELSEVADELSAGGGDAGGGLLAVSGGGAGVALGGGGGAAAGSVPPRSASEL